MLLPRTSWLGCLSMVAAASLALIGCVSEAEIDPTPASDDQAAPETVASEVAKAVKRAYAAPSSAFDGMA